MRARCATQISKVEYHVSCDALHTTVVEKLPTVLFVCATRFEVEEWSVREEDVKDPRLWDKAWDDDSVNDPLGRQLREKLPAAIQQQQQQQQAPVQ